MEDARQAGDEQQVDDLEVEASDAEDVKGGAEKVAANVKSQQQVRNAQAKLEELE